MARIKFKPNLAAFNAFRNSDEVTAILEAAGNEMAARATAVNPHHTVDGDPFRVTTVHNRSRAVVFVATANLDGILAEATDRALSKAVGG